MVRGRAVEGRKRRSCRRTRDGSSCRRRGRRDRLTFHLGLELGDHLLEVEHLSSESEDSFGHVLNEGVGLDQGVGLFSDDFLADAVRRERRKEDVGLSSWISERKGTKHSRDHISSNLPREGVVHLRRRVVVGGNECLVDQILDRFVDLEGRRESKVSSTWTSSFCPRTGSEGPTEGNTAEAKPLEFK